MEYKCDTCNKKCGSYQSQQIHNECKSIIKESLKSKKYMKNKSNLVVVDKNKFENLKKENKELKKEIKKLKNNKDSEIKCLDEVLLVAIRKMDDLLLCLEDFDVNQKFTENIELKFYDKLQEISNKSNKLIFNYNKDMVLDIINMH